MKRIPITLQAGETRSAEVLLYDVIGQDFFGGGYSAKQFAEDLKALGELDEINVRINSPGGDAFDGVTIYNVLAQHPAKVVVDIDGLAASAASVVAMAGDEIRMADNALLMIHNAHGVSIGDKEVMLKMAELLERIDQNIAATYAKRTGQRPSAFLKAMSAETWYTAKEAKEAKLIDSITPAKKVAACYSLEPFKFQHAPPQVAALFEEVTVTVTEEAEAATVEATLPGESDAVVREGVLFQPLDREAVDARLRSIDMDDAIFSPG